MLSTKCGSCKNKPWSQCCDWCQGKPFNGFICNKSVTYREKLEHLQYHYSDPNQYLTCRICNIYKHISLFRFKHYTCKSCTKY